MCKAPLKRAGLAKYLIPLAAASVCSQGESLSGSFSAEYELWGITHIELDVLVGLGQLGFRL